MSPRQYTLGKRAVGAQSTRDQILRSAGTLVARGGWPASRSKDVAQHAGVARLTVYKHFNSKAGLLEALAWSVFARADIGRIREARLHPDVDTALRSFIVENTRFLDAVGKHGRAVLSWAISDPETRAAVDAT